MLLATHSECSLEEAETVLVIERFQGKHTSYHVKKLRFLTAQEIMSVTIFSIYSFPTRFNDFGARSLIAISSSGAVRNPSTRNL